MGDSKSYSIIKFSEIGCFEILTMVLLLVIALS